MLQTMLVPGVTHLQNTDEINHWDNHPFIGTWHEPKKTHSGATINRAIKKKCKRVRTAFTTDQIRALEKTFVRYKYINSENRRELSKELNIGEKCIKIWFQNRRMKEKRESSESSDSSSETIESRVSPIVVPEPKVQPAYSESMYQQNNQYQTHAYTSYSYYYQTPAFQNYNVSETSAYEAPTAIMPTDNDFINSLGFCADSNPYPTQYYPSETEVDGCSYQNQYQNNNDVYNYLCGNDTDLFDF